MHNENIAEMQGEVVRLIARLDKAIRLLESYKQQAADHEVHVLEANDK